MHGRQLRSNVIKSAVLLAVGLGLALAARRNYPSSGWHLAADILFAQATVFLVWGLIHLLGNMHMFTSFTWGFKSFHKLIQGKQDNAKKMKDDYLAYRSSRNHHRDVPYALIGSAVLLALSILCSLMVA